MLPKSPWNSLAITFLISYPKNRSPDGSPFLDTGNLSSWLPMLRANISFLQLVKCSLPHVSFKQFINATLPVWVYKKKSAIITFTNMSRM